MDTKPVYLVEIEEAWIPDFAQDKCRELAEKQMEQLQELLGMLLTDINGLVAGEWVQMRVPDVCYHNGLIAFFPNFSEFSLGSSDVYYDYDPLTFHSRFSGFEGRLVTVDEFREAFAQEWDNLRREVLWDGGSFDWFAVDIGQRMPAVIGRDGDPDPFYHWNCSAHEPCCQIPICRLAPEDAQPPGAGALMLFWMGNGYEPLALSAQARPAYRYIMSLYQHNPKYFSCEEDAFQYDEELLTAALLSGEIPSFDGDSLDAGSISHMLADEMPLDAPPEMVERVVDRLLLCDKVRSDIERYDEKLLADPNRGHWDLWEPVPEGAASARLQSELVARNPLADVNQDGVIGIDFGTRSTVVVFQEASEHTLPMRIGTGNLSQKIEPSHYENPTVMEFNDIDHFMRAYKRKPGRPDTDWKDITTSHAAYQGFLNSSNGEYYAYLSELKRWAGDRRRNVRLRDKAGKDVALPPFLELAQDELDPIELYAYFIGLYINNMHNGIYLDYLLSFPVSYEKAVREKILESFSKGLRKSLPVAVLNDAEAMADFRVTAGTSEPAAYAICALQEYGFEPEGDESIFYGVFDFGGGTTDFDFGLWREADPKERRYDYTIECFGAGGDKYLGGENLLELLSFEVFKYNQDKLREAGVTFILPPECKKFPGCEVLLSESQEAQLNMTQLMERLRPLWERSEGYEEQYKSGKIQVNLFERGGQLLENFELQCSVQDLEKLLYKRIEKGIRNFFDGLREAFMLPETQGIDYVSIFLAGNSSKSPLVAEIFDKYIGLVSEQFAQEGSQKFFAVFPPLGSQQAIDKQREAGIAVEPEEVTRPTGKTGVAFGLVESRPGSRIKVIEHNNKEDSGEICFQYYVGYERKKRFFALSDRTLAYGEWREFIDAGAEDFTLYYTNLPEAGNNKLAITQVSRKKCRIAQTYPDANIYYRAVKPTVLEYVVATPQGIETGDFLEEIVRLDLD